MGAAVGHVRKECGAHGGAASGSSRTKRPVSVTGAGLNGSCWLRARTSAGSCAAARVSLGFMLPSCEAIWFSTLQGHE
jgi:hypothetical protein